MRLSFPQLALREQPLVYFASAFIAGELAARFSGTGTTRLLYTGCGLFLISGILMISKRNTTPLLLLTSFACGGLLWALDADSVGKTRIRQFLDQNVIDPEEPLEFRGHLAIAPELASDRIYLDIVAEAISITGKEMPATGIVHFVVPFTELQDRLDYDALGLEYGSRIRAMVTIRKAQGFRNPGSPDFDELLEYRGYDGVGVVKSPLLIETLGDAPRNRALAMLYTLRANALAVILRTFKQPASGILAAALFGNQHFLAKETAESFRIGGTFHLLVISGSHVAMLALITSLLISKLIRTRWLRFSLSVTALWAYALMIGAQPAISRATVMLTLVLFGQLIFRKAAGLNMLGASAIALLAWQPRDLFNPAFQLSFLTALMIVAVAGPLLDRIKRCGEWRPTTLTPYPPRLPAGLRSAAELLFWNELQFRKDQTDSPIHYRLEKAELAKWLSATRPRRFAQQCLTWSLATVIATSIVQIGLLPVMIAYFHRASLVSPVTNVIQGALISALMLTGLVLLLVHPISQVITAKLAFAVNGLGWLTAHAGDWLIAWRRMNFRVPDYGHRAVWLYTAFFILAGIFILLLSRWNPFLLHRRRSAVRGLQIAQSAGIWCSAVSLLALVILLLWHPHPNDFEPGRLAVSFIDVGQGDSILLRFPHGSVMLMDAGGGIPVESREAEGDPPFIEDRISIGEVAVSPMLWHFGIKRLDLIAASHAHSDHVQGFEDVGRSFVIKEAVTGVIPTGEKQFEPFRQAAALSDAPIRSLGRGDHFEVDGVLVSVLAPFSEGTAIRQSTNNQSLVLLVKYGEKVFLLTGDIEKEVEAELVRRNDKLKCDVLKVAHHGSRSSSTPEFLALARPSLAIISVSHPSPFNHPHAETIAGLNRIDARILQTSRCGAITVSTDGRDLKFETFVKCE